MFHVEHTGRPMTQILAVANQKGGVGKTTTAVTLGHALAMAGHSTLIVDLDPQGSATTGLGAAKSRSGLLLRIMHGQEPPAKIGILVRSVEPGLDLVPCDITSQEDEGERVTEPGLQGALGELAAEYRWILLDCPPSRGFLTASAIKAADLVLLPMQAEFFALDAARQMSEFLESEGLDVPRERRRVLITMYKDDNALAREVRDDIEEHYAAELAGTTIPRDGAVPESAGFGKTVFQHAPESLAARAYAQLAKEMMHHVG